MTTAITVLTHEELASASPISLAEAGPIAAGIAEALAAGPNDEGNIEIRIVISVRS